MQIRLASVMVNDHETALQFCINILGFLKNKDIPMGSFRWLTVPSPEERKASSYCRSPWVSRLLRPIKRRCSRAFQPAADGFGRDVPGEPQSMGLSPPQR
jgi:hypothetical protein